jgi:membrane protease YdiL (CAAX protease family)
LAGCYCSGARPSCCSTPRLSHLSHSSTICLLRSGGCFKLSKGIAQLMNRSPLKFFLLVFALSIPFWLMQPRDWPISASVGAPLLAALILVYREEGGGPGVRRILSRVFDQWRIRNKIWNVPIIFLMPLIYLLTYLVMCLMGLPFPDEPYFPFLLIPLLFVLFFIFAIGEEVGWTGYVTDPMQERWSALTSSIILGLVTAIWHSVPLIQMGRTPTWIAWWALSSVSIRILTVWVYNNTRRSLFAAILFHAMNNLSFALFPNYGSHWNPAVDGVITAIAAVIVTFLWGPRTLARYRYA